MSGGKLRTGDVGEKGKGEKRGNIMIEILKERQKQVYEGGKTGEFDISCNRASVAGSVSQRACVFCGSRVVLYPIADALHVVHGPIGE